jgi:hypothetical protein
MMMAVVMVVVDRRCCGGVMVAVAVVMMLHRRRGGRAVVMVMAVTVMNRLFPRGVPVAMVVHRLPNRGRGGGHGGGDGPHGRQRHQKSFHGRYPQKLRASGGPIQADSRTARPSSPDGAGLSHHKLRPWRTGRTN